MTNQEGRSTGVTPVLAEIPADFDQLTSERQDRFAAELAAQLMGQWQESRRPQRPEYGSDDHGQ